MEFGRRSKEDVKGSGLKKEPGCSLVEVKGNFVKFTIGDSSHARIEEIKGILNVISWEVDETSLYLKNTIPL